MSQWGGNFNENYYYNQNSLSYDQENGLNGTFEGLSNFRTSRNADNTSTHSAHQSSMTFIANGGGMHTDDEIHGSGFHLPRNNQSRTPAYNLEISSEILNRAANSQLTPTAGEFFPRSSHQSYNCQAQGLSQENQMIHVPRTNSSSNFVNGVTSSRSNEPRESQRPSAKDTGYHQRKNCIKEKKHSSKSQNIEQSKAEGRKKLLEEAAGISVKKTNDSSSSRVPSESIRRQSQSSTNNSYMKENRNSGNKIFSRSLRSQNVYQPHPYSPHKKSSIAPSQQNRSKGGDDAASQRERLTNQLNRGTLECLVCCEVVRQTDHTWCCHNCYHVMHLKCIVKWANTSKADNGWRCPACQNVTMVTPKDYYCFCGKTRNPDWSRTDTAHSCGELCGRPKVLASEHYKCAHHCTLLCHPGPCPPCTALVTRNCGCGKSSQSVQCGQTQPLVCREVCNKPLICGFHHCQDKCHLGYCQPCNFIVNQGCFCGKEQREVQCDGKNVEGDKYSCEKTCESKLSCGEHQCEQLCHEGACGACQRDPLKVTHCHCGKTALTNNQIRTSCLDPIPSCGMSCGRQLLCGQPGSPHGCKAECHEGMCPPCESTTLVRCRCGHMDQELPCIQVTTRADDARCQKKCSKKRTCGKHKCNQKCCIDVDHVCPLPCNHMLSCGKHRCDQLCHRGHCLPCLQSSFEELYCECGSSVLMPPIPCGTKPPPCNRPCSRSHDCDHEVLHMCHSYPSCPPCGVLTAKYCHGKHELRKAVPCHMSEFSCGLPCGKALVCGRHKCIQPCHNNECTAVCKQPCITIRDICGHPCNLPCHDGDCIDSPCKEKVVVTCECGHLSVSRPCFENNSEYQRIATALLASKMADVQLGRSVNLGDMKAPRKITIKTLECTEECRVLERNRRLAIGLQIRNPDLSAKLTPRYSDFMRTLAKKDQRLCQHVHDKLTELVKLAKESKQKSRSYSFETMNREKRQFVHEYCTHFGCESVAYDAEPKRNVVATAQRDKSWLPSYSLLEVVQREMGHRKIPLPNLNLSSQKTTPQSEVLPVRVALNQPAKNTPVHDTPQTVDYFDFNG